MIRISYLVRPILAQLYKGDKFEDPIDGKKYKKLLPYGYKGMQRENALAPGWNWFFHQGKKIAAYCSRTMFLWEV